MAAWGLEPRPAPPQHPPPRLALGLGMVWGLVDSEAFLASPWPPLASRSALSYTAATLETDGNTHTCTRTHMHTCVSMHTPI